jgi:hypothetical protein
MEPNQIQAECDRVRRAIPNYEDVVPSVVPSDCSHEKSFSWSSRKAKLASRRVTWCELGRLWNRSESWPEPQALTQSEPPQLPLAAASTVRLARARDEGSNPRCAFSGCAAEVWIDLHLPRLQQPFWDVAVILVLCAPGSQLNRTDTGLVREAQLL